MSENPIPDISVRVTLSRKVGPDTITLDAQSYAPADMVPFEYNRLYGLLRTAIVDYINNVAPTLPPGDRETPRSEAGKTWVKIDSISLSIQNGTRLAKVHGGEFSKFGVAVYPEVWERHNFDIGKLPDDGFKPKSLAALIGKDGRGKYRVFDLSFVGVPTP